MSTNHRLTARLALLLATIIWATSFVVVQRALVVVPVFHLMFFRFALAAVLLLPLARGVVWERGLIRDGLGVGAWLFAGFALQTASLLGTTPSRAAFLTGLSVVLVPALALVRGRRPSTGAALGALLAGIGLWVLYLPAAKVEATPWGWGDWLGLAGAFAFAGFVLAAEITTRRRPLGPLALIQFGAIALLCLPSLVIQPPTAAELAPRSLLILAAIGVFNTALAFLAQLYAQRHLSAVEAGVILTLEPVLAAAFSVSLGLEHWTLPLTAGGLLIVGAMLVTELWPIKPNGETASSSTFPN